MVRLYRVAIGGGWDGFNSRDQGGSKESPDSRDDDLGFRIRRRLR